MTRARHFFWGAMAGLAGSVAGVLLLWGSWLLPSLGLVLTRVNLVEGSAALFLAGAIGGGFYGLLTGESRLTVGSVVLSGLILGLALWIAVALVAVPMLLGFPVQLGSPLDHWMPLVALSFYGVITALLYSRWALHLSSRRIMYAAGLVLLAGFLTPFLLRAAVSTDPRALDLPAGYRAEVVAKGFTYPTSLLLDGDTVYLAEGGFAYGPKTTDARILRVDNRGRVREVARDFEGPINGLALHGGKLFVSHRGKITAVDPENNGERKDLVTRLPSLGDHHNNDLVVGEDGALYFGQGSATNAGVVGPDNFVYAWADRHPTFHDFPSRPFTMTGENYTAPHPGSANPADTRTTGAFAPFGETRERGESLRPALPASGAVHRLDLETGQLSLFADGLRNPYGLTVGPDGTLYATNLGYDDRGVRAVKGSPDWVVRLREGSWYGWPDYAGTIPLTEPLFASERGENRRPLIADPPPVEPPLATLPPHISPLKLDYAPEEFGRSGLFVAVFGDGHPITGDLSRQVPTGVLQVDPLSGRFQWFVRNREGARAGRTGNGLKRAIDAKFTPDGKSMYLLDFGVMEFTGFAPNAIPRTGVLWKITRAQ